MAGKMHEEFSYIQAAPVDIRRSMLQPFGDTLIHLSP